LIKNKTVLDIGGATGFNFEYIKDYVDIYKSVTILDLCGSLLKEADKRIKKNKWKRCNTLHQDVMKFNSGVKYDIIMISYTLTMVPDWKLILDKIYSLLPKGGYLMITDFTVDNNNSGEGLLWKNIFKQDKVYLNSEHVPYIRKKLKELFYKEEFGDFPYFPNFVKCRYYYGVYKK
jgi:ubiquinone/menaquinone biosynthesis C-methylase UbiE